MKKVLAFFSILIVSALTVFGFYKEKTKNEVVYRNQISAEQREYTDVILYDIEFKTADPSIEINAATKEGSIKIRILDKYGNAIFEKSSKNIEKTLKVSNTTEAYTAQITFESFTGSYKIYWN